MQHAHPPLDGAARRVARRPACAALAGLAALIAGSATAGAAAVAIGLALHPAAAQATMLQERWELQTQRQAQTQTQAHTQTHAQTHAQTQPAPAGRPSDAVLHTAQRVRASADAAGLPFAVVDKRSAQLVVFHADGRLAGASPALLGRDLGDHTVPGVGERTQAGALQPGDATTPSGRFDARPGPSLAGDDVVWLDYGAAFAIHRVRPGPNLGNRLQRLATATPSDNRVSAGCVVVPVAFYESVVQPVLGQKRGVVYVLPDSGDNQPLWQALGRSGL